MDWHWQQEEILPFPYHPVDGEREREKEREGEKETERESEREGEREIEREKEKQRHGGSKRGKGVNVNVVV